LPSVYISLGDGLLGVYQGKFEGAKPLQEQSPLSFEGEGDTGGEVDEVNK